MTTTLQSQTDLHLSAVQRMYAAFGRGDVAAVLAEVTDDTDWVSVSETGSATVPWYGSYQGRDEIPKFFERIGMNVEVTGFSPLAFATNETDVMVALRWSFTVRSTGKSANLALQHWFRFTNGKVSQARTVEDSEQTAQAFT